MVGSWHRSVLSVVLGVLGAVALGYTLLRAALLSFTHDESVTYLYFVDSSFWETLKYNGFSPSNNHLLNSLLMRISAALFGSGELALRLPSWLGHGLYVAAAVLLVRRLRHPLAAVCTFVLLLANPFLLDFFSLARGYGLAMGFLLAGLYALVTTLEEPAPRPFRALIAFALLACAGLSHFSFLNVYLAAAAVFIVMAWRRGAARSAGAVAALSAFYVAGVLPVLLKLRRGGELYHGGEKGFIADTVRSLVGSTLYGDHPLHRLGRPLALAVAALLLFLISSLVVWMNRRRPAERPAEHPIDGGAITSAVAVVTALGILLQHHLFGTRFVTDRSALFFLPLFFLTLGAAVDRGLEVGRRLESTAFAAVYTGLALLLLAHTVSRANLTHTDAWRYDADTKGMIDHLATLERDAPPEDQPRRTLGVFWAFEPAVNYYIRIRDLDWLEPVDRGGLTVRDYDYYFYSPDQADRLAGRGLEEIARFPVTGNVLARRGEPTPPSPTAASLAGRAPSSAASRAGPLSRGATPPRDGRAARRWRDRELPAPSPGRRRGRGSR